MVLNCLLNTLGFDADVPLGGGSGTVLQQPLDKGNVEPVFVVDFRCVPLAEAVGADALKAQIVAHDFQLLLDCPFRNGENQFIAPDAIAQTVVLNVLLNDKGNCENSALARLLLNHFQSVSVCVPHDIARAQFQNIADAQAQVPFQNKGGCDALIGSATTEPLLHGLDDFGVLLCGQSLGFLVHGCPPMVIVRIWNVVKFVFFGGFPKGVEIQGFWCSYL